MLLENVRTLLQYLVNKDNRLVQNPFANIIAVDIETPKNLNINFP
jgi:hypothetical protein